MPYCSRCGINAQDKKVCPLCFAPIQFLDEIEYDTKPAYPKTGKLQRFTKKEKLFFIWLPLAASLLAAIVICIVINLSQGAISWSKYPTVSLGATILILTGSFLFAKRLVILNFWTASAITGLLFFLDLFTGTPSWFYQLALPIVLYTLACSLLLTLFARFFQKNISILFLFLSSSIALFCPLLEILIHRYNRSGNLSWSLIVTIVFSTLASIELIYIMFVKKRVDLQKFFHT